MLIAEDVLLLATDDATGKSTISALQLDPALAGAVLIELVVAGRVNLLGEGRQAKVVVTDGTPLGDPVLDVALQSLIDKAPLKPVQAIRLLAKGLRARLNDLLEQRGILRRESGKVLGLFPTTSWPATSVEHESVVRRNLVGQLVQGLTPDPRTAALVALLHALRCTHKVVVPAEHGLGRRELDRRAKQLAEGSWGSQAVRQTIDAMTAAVAAAVAVTAAGASGG